MTFVMTVPFLLVLIGQRSTWLIFRILGVVTLAVILIAMYYTNSRGAIVGLGATHGRVFLHEVHKPLRGLGAAAVLSAWSPLPRLRGEAR